MLLFDGELHGSIHSCSFSRRNAVLKQTTRRSCPPPQPIQHAIPTSAGLLSTGSPVRRAATRGPKDQWEKVSNERVLSDVFNIVQSAVRARVGGVCVVQTSTSKNNSVDRSQATVMEKWTTTTTTHHRLRTRRFGPPRTTRALAGMAAVARRCRAHGGCGSCGCLLRLSPTPCMCATLPCLTRNATLRPRLRLPAAHALLMLSQQV